MKTMTIDQVKNSIVILSRVAQEQVLRLLNRKMNELPILAGAYKTRTKWWGSKVKVAVGMILKLARAMANRRSVTIDSIDFSDFCGDDIASYKKLPTKSSVNGYRRNDHYFWTPPTCTIVRNLIASVAMDLSKSSDQRARLEEWVAYPPKCVEPVRGSDPVLDDRVHPGVAIKKGIDFFGYTGHRLYRQLRVVQFALHSLLGIRPGEEMTPENFRLDEFDIDERTGRFLSRPDGPGILRKRYHKQNRTPSYYQIGRSYLTIVPPAAKEILEPWLVKRICEDGASISDPVLPDYTRSREYSFYQDHRPEISSAMGLYSSKGLDPYCGRKLYNRCLRLFPTTEMQAILNSMARYVNVTDDHVKCMVYIAMRQSLKHIVDFNWENYDTLIGPEGHIACLMRALELALNFDPNSVNHPVIPVVHNSAEQQQNQLQEIDRLRSELCSVRIKMDSAERLSGEERFTIVARKYEIEAVLRSYGVDLNQSPHP